MKKTLMILLSLAFVLQILVGCTGDQSSAKSIEQLYKENGVPVKVEQVKLQPFANTQTFHAILTGIKESTASAKVADKVETIHYKVGDRVKKNAVVISFPIDNPAAQFNQAKVSFEHAKVTLKRMQNLYENGGISLQEYENTKTQFEVAKANWESVRQSVKITAPIDGVITQMNVRETDNVEPEKILFTVSQTHKLKSTLWITENRINDIQPGDKATAIWQGKTIEGKTVQVDISMNKDQQAFGAMVEFDNPESQLMSGVNAEIKIFSEQKEKIMIARKNIQRVKNDYFVYIAKDDSAIKKFVIPGSVHNFDIEILSGLQSGDMLITEGQMMLNDNMKIRIVNE